ncbi:phospholipase A2-like isoform X3 [Vespula squamosa]|uniref:Phospholipase A2-like isoform X3 n=1 Tax=Vespula squamosa TaxID=30214 RepID=A0ABD2BTC7_VESSQ
MLLDGARNCRLENEELRPHGECPSTFNVGKSVVDACYPRRCLEYELDESQTKRYQWFDVPLYAKTTMFHDINDVNPIGFARSHN